MAIVRELFPDEAAAQASATNVNRAVEASTNDALNYFNNGMASLDKMIVGEEAAKRAILTGIIIERPVVLAGPPAGGKSSVMHESWRLIAGVNEEDIARIPGEHDIQAIQLVGGVIPSVQEITEGNGDTHTVRKLTRVEGMVKPTTKIVMAEELTRLSPEAANALLPIAESRRLETSEGHVDIPDLALMIAAVNASENRQATFNLSDAMISRFTLGAIMGRKGTREERLNKIGLVLAHKEAAHDLDSIQPIVNSAQRKAIKAYADATAISDTTRSKIMEVALNTNDLFQSHGIEEADTRIPLHIMAIAKALGSFRTEQRIVRDEDIADATHSIISARFGSKKRTADLDIDDLTKTVTNL